MLKEEFPGTKFLLGPGLHRVAPGVEEVRGGTYTTRCIALDSFQHQVFESTVLSKVDALLITRTRVRCCVSSTGGCGV